MRGARRLPRGGRELRETADSRTELLGSRRHPGVRVPPAAGGRARDRHALLREPDEDELSEDDLALMQAVTHHFAIAMDRVHTQKLLRESEASLLQSQKMESVAMLASGIAHESTTCWPDHRQCQPGGRAAFSGEPGGGDDSGSGQGG